MVLEHPADEIVTDLPLGAIYTPEKTQIRVWAPTASVVTLNLYESPTGGKPRHLAMKRIEDEMQKFSPGQMSVSSLA